MDSCLGALINEAVETCKNAKSDGESVVISVPDEWDEGKANDFTKIFEAVSKLNVLRTLKRSTAIWIANIQGDNINENENYKNQEERNVLIIRIGGNSTTGKIPYFIQINRFRFCI